MAPIDLTVLSKHRLVQHLAVHESGHAVVGARAGFTVRAVQLISGEQCASGTMGAWTHFDAPDDDQVKLARAHPQEMAIVLLAGSLAEERILGNHAVAGYTEDIRILRLGLGWERPLGRWQQRRLERIIGLARDAVRREEGDIRRLASALTRFGELDQLQISRLLDRTVAAQ